MIILQRIWIYYVLSKGEQRVVWNKYEFEFAKKIRKAKY